MVRTGLAAAWLISAAQALAATPADTAAAAASADAGAEVYAASCAGCHEGGVPKAPHRSMLQLMTADAILKSLDDGLMQAQAAALTPAERRAVAEHVAGSRLGAGARHQILDCPAGAGGFDPGQPPVLQNWGLSAGNTRYIEPADGGLPAADIGKLEPRVALAFPDANRARSQPAFAGGLVFVGSHSGIVYALDPRTGCAHWRYQAAGEVRTAIVVEPWSTSDGGQPQPRLFFGDVLGNVYALDAASGRALWRQRADDHPNATITGTPSYYDGRLYVPVSSLEVALAIDPLYPCCTFRGSVVAYDVRDGAPVWRTYTIAEAATEQSRNRAGTPMFGPSGAVIWNSPTIDPVRQQLYVATGENMSSPATATSDAIFAMDLATGAVNWMFQATRNDVWNTACDTETDHSCPPEAGPDFDFGAATMLVHTRDGKPLVVGGQKSGVVHALDPDTGEVVWQQRVGRGGIQGGIHFGMAASPDRLYVPVSDMADGRSYDHPERPGLHALDLATGEPLWYAPAADACRDRAFCHPGISQAVTAVGDLVIAGSMDGVLRVHDGRTGSILRSIDTTVDFVTPTGASTRGGSFGGAAGPVVFGGRLIVSSGYGIYNHMPGNLVLILSPEG